ncbi:MAG: RNA polymerase sigma factor [Gemmataceae bacterium]
MSKRVASVTDPPPMVSDGAIPPGDLLVRTFQELRDDLLSTLFFLLGHTEDVQDVAQEVFMKCWRAREGLAGIQDLRAWIFRIGLNTAKDLRRSAWKRRARPLQGEPNMIMSRHAPPAEEAENREDCERLRQAILALRPEEQEVFLLRQNGDLTYEQIAEIRHSPVGTVKTQMRSALQKLRQVLA